MPSSILLARVAKVSAPAMVTPPPSTSPARSALLGCPAPSGGPALTVDPVSSACPDPHGSPNLPSGSTPTGGPATQGSPEPPGSPTPFPLSALLGSPDLPASPNL
ncbi:hypothetical protein H0H81_009636, partial [Sphagnurus paluster]